MPYNPIPNMDLSGPAGWLNNIVDMVTKSPYFMIILLMIMMVCYAAYKSEIFKNVLVRR